MSIILLYRLLYFSDMFKITEDESMVCKELGGLTTQFAYVSYEGQRIYFHVLFVFHRWQQPNIVHYCINDSVSIVSLIIK